MNWILVGLMLVAADSSIDSVRIDSSFCGNHKVYVERKYRGRRAVEQTVFVYRDTQKVELFKLVTEKRAMVRVLSDDMNYDFRQDLIIEERHIGHPDSLVFHIYRFVGSKPVKIDDVNIGYGGLDSFTDLDGDGVKEIISWDRRLAGIGGLDPVISPLVPKIYKFNGHRYVPRTRRYGGWLKKVAKQYEVELFTAVHQDTPEEFVKSKAMGLVAVYSLLGNTSAGLAKVRRIAPDVYQWVKENIREMKRRLGR